MDDWSGRRRSLAWLAWLPVGVVICAVLASIGAHRDGQPFISSATVAGAIGGAVIGGGLGIYSAAVAWRLDSRIVRVRRRHPGSVVVNAADLSATGTALGMMFGTNPVSGHSYTVAFDADGMHVYAGHALTPVVEVPWPLTTDVHEELVREFLKSQHAVVVGVRLHEGAIGLPWGISGTGRPASPAVVARVRSQIEAVRAAALSRAGTPTRSGARSAPAVPPRPPAPGVAPATPPTPATPPVPASVSGSPPLFARSARPASPASASWPAPSGQPAPTPSAVAPPSFSATSWPYRHELRPGFTSKTWARLAAAPGIVSGLVVVVSLALRFGTDALSGASGLLLPAIVIAVMSLLSVSLLALSNIVAKREVAAGYTLSRLGPIEVDQVDAATGFVVRRAGHPQFSKAQEEAATARVRQIDGR